MTPEQREYAYKASRSVQSSNVPRAAAVKEVTQLGVPEGSATILIDVYLALRRGAVFKRALAEADMDRFLRGIAEDDGADALALALNAFARHISYRESIGNAQPGNRALYANHLAKVSIPDRV